MRRLILVPALLIAVGCQDHTLVQPGSSTLLDSGLVALAPTGDLPKMVPMEGLVDWWATTMRWGCEGGEDNLAADWEATGTLPHLGLSHFTGTNCFRYLEDAPDPDFAWEFVSQSATVVTANGDLLYWYGTPPKTSLEFLSATAYRMGPFWFTGGTGRFANATGEIMEEGTQSEDYLTGTSFYHGHISSVGSSR